MRKIFSFFLFFIISVFYSQETSKEFQDNLNKEFANPEESPLMREDLATFKELDFFPIDEKYIIHATFIRTEGEKTFQMKTSTDRLPEYKKYGELHFTLNSEELKLNVYQNIKLIEQEEYKDYLFLPFSDLTNGKETYIGGRYIDLRIQKGTTWVIDFNKAYNPYCAYNYKYSCPKIPLENDLNIEIIAGVKKFHD